MSCPGRFILPYGTFVTFSADVDQTESDPVHVARVVVAAAEALATSETVFHVHTAPDAITALGMFDASLGQFKEWFQCKFGSDPSALTVHNPPTEPINFLFVQVSGTFNEDAIPESTRNKGGALSSFANRAPPAPLADALAHPSSTWAAEVFERVALGASHSSLVVLGSGVSTAVPVLGHVVAADPIPFPCVCAEASVGRPAPASISIPRLLHSNPSMSPSATANPPATVSYNRRNNVSLLVRFGIPFTPLSNRCAAGTTPTTHDTHVTTSSSPSTGTATATTRATPSPFELLIDCGKTFRDTVLSSVSSLAPRLTRGTFNAVAITHDHCDAMGGLDDIRDFQTFEMQCASDAETGDGGGFVVRTPMPCILSPEANSVLRTMFGYIVEASEAVVVRRRVTKLSMHAAASDVVGVRVRLGAGGQSRTLPPTPEDVAAVALLKRSRSAAAVVGEAESEEKAARAGNSLMCAVEGTAMHAGVGVCERVGGQATVGTAGGGGVGGTMTAEHDENGRGVLSGQRACASNTLSVPQHPRTLSPTTGGAGPLDMLSPNPPLHPPPHLLDVSLPIRCFEGSRKHRIAAAAAAVKDGTQPINVAAMGPATSSAEVGEEREGGNFDCECGGEGCDAAISGSSLPLAREGDTDMPPPGKAHLEADVAEVRCYPVAHGCGYSTFAFSPRSVPAARSAHRVVYMSDVSRVPLSTFSALVQGEGVDVLFVDCLMPTPPNTRDVHFSHVETEACYDLIVAIAPRVVVLVGMFCSLEHSLTEVAFNRRLACDQLTASQGHRIRRIETIVCGYDGCVIPVAL